MKAKIFKERLITVMNQPNEQKKVVAEMAKFSGNNIYTNEWNILWEWCAPELHYAEPPVGRALPSKIGARTALSTFLVPAQHVAVKSAKDLVRRRKERMS